MCECNVSRMCACVFCVRVDVCRLVCVRPSVRRYNVSVVSLTWYAGRSRWLKLEPRRVPVDLPAFVFHGTAVQLQARARHVTLTITSATAFFSDFKGSGFLLTTHVHVPIFGCTYIE